MIKQIFLIAIIFLVAVSFVSGQEVPQRIYTVPSVKESPVIDGKLDDACWQGLVETSDFTCLRTRSGLAEAQTYVKIGMTEKDLLVAFRCCEPQMDKVLQALKIKDGFSESVEVFIDINLDRSTYNQYLVSSGGSLLAHKGYGGPHGGNVEDFRAAVSYEKDAWIVEATIPFSLIGDTPKTGQLWGLNLNRTRSVVAPISLDCWSQTSGSFHEPAAFGQLLFGSVDNWKKTKYSMDMRIIEKQLRTIIKKFSKSIPNGGEFLKQLQPSAEMNQCKITEEADMLATMKDMLDRQKKAEEVLKTVRLMVIRGEFK